MGLVTFMHKHPLILNEEERNDFKENSCRVCCQPISGPCYSCTECIQFFLHKVCAELPRQMQHPQHPQHPLTLLADRRCFCDVCDEICSTAFAYHCSICDFDVDIFCALMSQPIIHRGHKHPLIALQTPGLFICHACSQADQGVSYICTTCLFWIHQKCASRPETIELSSHHHPLTLSYSLPPECQDFNSFCDLCSRTLRDLSWFYRCEDCRYNTHLDCAFRRIKMDGKTESEAEVIDPNLIQLPVIDKSVDLMNQFIKNISVGRNELAEELDHSSHRHQLSPIVVGNGDESDSSCLQSLMKHLICRGCMEPVSDSCYGCRECLFFLHKWCAELPNVLQHPCHPDHPLVLVTKPREIFYGMPRCRGCAGVCTGFTYICARGRSCQFGLDLHCASLPVSIRHEIHSHSLILKFSDGVCTACYGQLFGFAFTCETCNFNLHPHCAILPRKIKHRYDHHPYCLTYSSIKDIPEYYCGICESRVNPKCWFYHCLECDQSMHTHCLYFKNVLPNLEPGNFFKFTGHSHPLTVSEVLENDDASCECCGGSIGNDYAAFRCKYCSFNVHLLCVLLPDKVEHESDDHLLILARVGHSKEYYCLICKLVIDLKVFYHCSDCNHSVHVACIPGLINRLFTPVQFKLD